ncbi:MAG: hypothetical protein HGB15_06720 [Chlorobaculum sp.]|nr:hypothetical protein [Chlorobaculum sp.]
MLGAMIDQEVFVRTVDDEEGREHLSPFVIMSGFSDKESDLSEARRYEIRRGLIGDLGDCELDLQDYWEPWRKEYLAKNSAGRAVKAQPLVGRNDPCPCGSGKKFKQCCGK